MKVERCTRCISPQSDGHVSKRLYGRDHPAIQCTLAMNESTLQRMHESTLQRMHADKKKSFRRRERNTIVGWSHLYNRFNAGVET